MDFLAFFDVAGLVFCLSLACSVFGLTICRILRWRWILQQGLGLNAVIGLAAALVFLEVWNFLFPVNHASVCVLFIFILGSAILLRRTLIEVFRDWISISNAITGLSLLILLLLVSWFGLGSSEHDHFDTGLYYLTTIRWAQDYSVVPGLANLHSRLGFNQSLFLFVAFLAKLMNLGLARACQVVNPIVVFISGWAVLDRLKLNLSMAKAKRARIYAVLLVCPLFFFATHMLISAPTADVAAAAYAVPGALAAFCGLEEILDRNASEASNWLIVLTVIGATLLKLKLSYSVLGGAAIGIAAVGLIFIQGREFYRTWARTTILAVVLFIPWAARGVILTGYPFYPLAFVRFRTDWTVPKETADSDRDWICAWAKSPNKEPKDVLHDDAWLAPWVERNAKDPQNMFLFLFVTAGLLSTLISLSIPMSRERRFLNVLITLPSALALVFWFETAPDPRFGYGALLLFGVNGFYAAGSALAQISLTRAAFFTCVVTAGSFLLIFRNELPSISRFPKAFPQGFPKAELVYKTTASGLRVGVASEQAWNSGLVVTPNFKPSLALRGVGLRDGFRIK